LSAKANDPKMVIRICAPGETINAPDKIGKSEIRNLLGKGWLTHDGMWLYLTGREFGIEKANALNRAAIKSAAPIEVQRAKKALGFGMDRFDADMILCLIGSITALLLLTKRHNRYLKQLGVGLKSPTTAMK
jgi:hypothetical protein